MSFRLATYVLAAVLLAASTLWWHHDSAALPVTPPVSVTPPDSRPPVLLPGPTPSPPPQVGVQRPAGTVRGRLVVGPDVGAESSQVVAECFVVDGSGAVTVHGGVSPGPFSLAYPRESNAPSWSIEFRLRGMRAHRRLPERETDVGDVTLAPAVSYGGVAVDLQGKPIVKATVTLTSESGAALASSLPSLSDGRFWLALPNEVAHIVSDPNGELRGLFLSARAADGGAYGALAARVEGLRGEHIARFLTDSTRRIRLVGDSGGALSGWVVEWRPAAGETLVDYAGSGASRLAQTFVTDDDGGFVPWWPACVDAATIHGRHAEQHVVFAVRRSDYESETATILRVPGSAAQLLVRVGGDSKVAPDGELDVQLVLRDFRSQSPLHLLLSVSPNAPALMTLGESASFAPARHGLLPDAHWASRHVGVDGGGRGLGGSAPVLPVPAGWEIGISVPERPNEVDFYWVTTGKASRTDPPPETVVLVFNTRSRGMRRMVGRVAAARGTETAVGVAWPLIGLDSTALQALDRHEVLEVSSVSMYSDNSISNRSQSWSDVQAAFSPATPLVLSPPGVQVTQVVRVVDEQGAAAGSVLLYALPLYAQDGLWFSLRTASQTREDGTALVPLVDALRPTFVLARDVLSGGTGSAVVGPSERGAISTVVLHPPREFKVRLRLPSGAIPGSESVRLETRPFWLAPRVACNRVGDGND